MQIMEENILHKALEQSMNYLEYRDLVNELFANAKVTGDIQSESYLNYTDLNIHRMNKWDKHFKVSNEVELLIKQLEHKETWMVINEGWCGDAAHVLPVINKLADLNENVQLKVVLRDANPELMNSFLTNGARSIPKLIRLSENNEVLGTWGPRPELGQKIIDEAKKYGTPMPDAKQALQLWYARDKGKNIEKEIAAMLAMG